MNYKALLLSLVWSVSLADVTPNIPAGTILGNSNGTSGPPVALSVLPSGVSISLGSVPGSTTRTNATTSFSVLSSDNNNVISSSNASATTCALPTIGTSGITANGFGVLIINTGAGTVTCTPASGTINTLANIQLLTGQAAYISAGGSTDYGALIGSPTTLPASQLTGGTMQGATALTNNAVMQATGFAPSSSNCPAGADRFNIPGTHQPGFCVNGTNVSYLDADSALHSLLAVPTLGATSGCTAIAAGTGDALGFEFVLTTTTGVCVFSSTWTSNPSKGANARWVCNGSDVTQGTTIFQTGLTSSTISTFKTGTGTANGDIITMQCKPI